jgi:F0F1-type ATP synthase assembly protein I
VRPRDEDEDRTSEEMGEGYALLTVGITFALTLTVFVLAGLWLDRRFGTTPLFTVVATIAGSGLGGYWMYLRIRRQLKEDDQRR